MQTYSLQVNKKQIAVFLAAVIVFGTIIRLMAGYQITVNFDTRYYEKWSAGVVDHGLFRAYFPDHIPSLDYPPIFLFPLYLIGLLGKTHVVMQSPYLYALLLKLTQILFDVGNICLLYLFFKKRPLVGLAASVLWAISPVLIFNASFWGQTDSIMIFLLLLTYYLMEKGMPVRAVMVFAIAGLTKYQSLYFAPVIFIYLLHFYPFKTLMKSIGAGLATFAAVFTPFAMGSGMGFIGLFRYVYFRAMGMYNGISLNAFNIYTGIGLNGAVDQEVHILPFLNALQLSNILLVLSVAGVVYLFYRSKNKCPWLLSALLIGAIFMFTTRQHERYQIAMLPFLLVAAFKHNSLPLKKVFIYQSVIIFFNHFMIFEYFVERNKLPWSSIDGALMVIFSWLNFLLFIYITVVAIKLMNQPKTEQDTAEPILTFG